MSQACLPWHNRHPAGIAEKVRSYLVLMLVAGLLGIGDRAGGDERWARALFENGVLAMDGHDWEAAAKCFEIYRRESPQGLRAEECEAYLAQIHLEHGRALQQEGLPRKAGDQFKRALQYCEGLAARKKRAALVAYIRASCLDALGKGQEAQREWSKLAEERGIYTAEALENLAEASRKRFEAEHCLADKKRAVEHYKRLIQLSSFADSNRVRRAEIALLPLEFGDTGGECKNAFELYFEGVEGLTCPARKRRREGGLDQIRASRRLAEKIIATHPDFCPAHYLVGLIRGTFAANDPELYDPLASVDAFRKARCWKGAMLAVGKYVLFRHGAGTCTFPDGATGTARQYLDAALALDPSHQEAHYLLGVLEWSRGNREDALSRWVKVLRIDPTTLIGTNALSELLRREDQLALLSKEAQHFVRQCTMPDPPRFKPGQEKYWGWTQLDATCHRFGSVWKDPEHKARIQSYQKLLDEICANIISEAEVDTAHLVDERAKIVIVQEDHVVFYALPGGYILASRGALEFVDSIAEHDPTLRKDILAFAIAHELAHITRGHTLESICARKYMLGLLGNSPEEEAFGDYFGSYARNHVRQRRVRQELEADAQALRYLYRTRYDPSAAFVFLRKYLIAYGEEVDTAEHPRLSLRIDSLSDYWNREIVYARALFRRGVDLLAEARRAGNVQTCWQAIQMFEEMCQRFPLQTAAQNNRGVAYQTYAQLVGEPNDLRPWRESLALDPVLRLRNIGVERAGEMPSMSPAEAIDAAEKAYARALERNPHYGMALSNRGALYALKGLLFEAIASYDRALRMCPGDARVLSNRACAHGRLADNASSPERSLSELDAAAADLDKALRSSPACVPARYNLVICHLRLYEQKKDGREKATYRSALARTIDDYLDCAKEEPHSQWRQVVLGIKKNLVDQNGG